MRNYLVFVALSAIGANAENFHLAALSMIESGNNDRAVGGAGEVSRFQIKPWIWRQYSQSEAYFNRRVSTEVAGNHLAVLEDTFRKRAGRNPTDFDIYVLWNAGPTYYARIGFAKSRVHPVIRDRARRYANLRRSLATKLANSSSASPPAVSARPNQADPNAPAIAKVTASEPLWPVFDVAQAGRLEPLFSLMPSEPPSRRPTIGHNSLFAVVGAN